jgi:translation initiation factor IF-3
VIGADGSQLGVLAVREALDLAAEAGLDLVEVAPNADPPVCKIIDYGKFRYDQTKREKESRKAQHQMKIKEIKLKPNINEHDFMTKLRQAKEFIEQGDKVKVTLVFRGREVIYPENGQKLLMRIHDAVIDIAQVESDMKMFGKTLIMVLAPKSQKGKSTTNV